MSKDFTEQNTELALCITAVWLLSRIIFINSCWYFFFGNIDSNVDRMVLLIFLTMLDYLNKLILKTNNVICIWTMIFYHAMSQKMMDFCMCVFVPRPGILMRQLKFQNEKIKYSRINWNRKEENKEWGNYWNLWEKIKAFNQFKIVSSHIKEKARKTWDQRMKRVN